MEESAGQFGSHLAVLAPDQAATSVNRSDPGHRQFRSTQFASVVGQAAIQAQFTELHYGSLADTTGAAKQAKRKDQQTANDRFGTPTSSGDCEPRRDVGEVINLLRFSARSRPTWCRACMAAPRPEAACDMLLLLHNRVRKPCISPPVSRKANSKNFMT